MATYSEELLNLNNQAVQAVIPAIVYVCVLMFLGLVGNPIVIYFYGWRQKATPSHTFIVALAIFDLVTCLVSMPLEIVDLVRFYTFESSDACKLLRLINYFASISSGFTLLAIAVDRYRKICKPFDKQITMKQCKIIIAVVLASSSLCSWPAAVFYQVVEVNITDSVNLTAFDCTTVRDEEYTIYITVYNIVLFVFFAISITVLVVLYALIGKKLFSLRGFQFYSQKSQQSNGKSGTNKKKNSSDGTGSSNVANSDSTTMVTEIADRTSNGISLKTISVQGVPPSSQSLNGAKVAPYVVEREDTELSSSSKTSTKSTTPRNKIDVAIHKENMLSIVSKSEIGNSQVHLKFTAASENAAPVEPSVETRDRKGTMEIDQKKLQVQNVNTRKYTIVMLSISIAFVVSFLPYLGLSTWRTLSKDYEPNLFSASELAAFQIGLRSFLISSASNPLIYGFLNTKFQNFALSILCFCCKSMRSKSQNTPQHSSAST